MGIPIGKEVSKISRNNIKLDDDWQTVNIIEQANRQIKRWVLPHGIELNVEYVFENVYYPIMEDPVAYIILSNIETKGEGNEENKKRID